MNKLKHIKKKLDKFCNKKVSVGYSIGVLLLILFVILGLEIGYLKIRNSHTYFYENIYGERGHSRHCKRINENYQCEQYVKVHWYVEE